MPSLSLREVAEVGKSCGVQRFKCNECGSTFNGPTSKALTGAALAGL